MCGVELGREVRLEKVNVRMTRKSTLPKAMTE
jgi:hypothetical protein